MLAGESFTFSGSGIHINASVMNSIGIGDHSMCWCNWFFPTEKEIKDAGNRHVGPQLFVTSYPTSVWPALLRLEVRLTRDRHAAQWLTNIVAEQFSLNVITAHAVPSGHHHLNCHFILDASGPVAAHIGAVQKRIEMTHSQLERAKVYEGETVHALANALLDCCMNVAKGIEEQNEALPHGERVIGKYLYSDPILRQALNRFDSRENHHGETHRLRAALESLPVGVKCTWLESYLYNWVFRAELDNELKYEFNGKSHKLIAMNPARHAQLVQALHLGPSTLPVKGIA